MITVYDGSFEGYLSLMYEVYYKKLKPQSITKNIPNTLFNEDYYEVLTNLENANLVLKALKSKFTKQNFQSIINVFMCDNFHFEIDLLKFIIQGFKNQNELRNINNEFVFNIQNLQKEYFRQAHKMTGFVRFQELEDKTLYAKIETKYNLVYHLGNHFLKRLNNQEYIIHDIKRGLAFIKNDNLIGIQNVSSFEDPTLSKDEEKFSKLWGQFFKSVSIDSRKNDRCQKNMVPLIYRVYMNEFE